MKKNRKKTMKKIYPRYFIPRIPYNYWGKESDLWFWRVDGPFEIKLIKRDGSYSVPTIYNKESYFVNDPNNYLEVTKQELPFHDNLWRW